MNAGKDGQCAEPCESFSPHCVPYDRMTEASLRQTHPTLPERGHADCDAGLSSPPSFGRRADGKNIAMAAAARPTAIEPMYSHV